MCGGGGRWPPPPSCDITIRPHHEVSVLATLPCVVVAAGGPRRRHAKSPFGPATRFLYSPRPQSRTRLPTTPPRTLPVGFRVSVSHQHHRGYNTASNASSASSSDPGFFSPGGGYRSPIAHSNAAASRCCCRRPILSVQLLSINAAPASQIGENDTLPHSAHSHRSEPSTPTAPAPAASAAFLSTVSNSPSVSSFSSRTASLPAHRTTAATTPPRTLPVPPPQI